MGDVEINQDLQFQRRFWKFQRLSWVAMTLVALAALLGLLGRGPLADATVGDKDGPLWVEYERFSHYQSLSVLRVHVGGGAGSKGLARIWLAHHYLKNLQIERVMPEPDTEAAASDGLIYAFRIAEPEEPTVITFYMTMNRIGSLSGQVGLAEGRRLSFSQFIYP